MKSFDLSWLVMLPAVLQAADAGKVIRIDPALDQLIPAGAQVEKVAEGFTFTEGPLWMPAGYLLFSDIPANKIRKWSPDGTLGELDKPASIIGPNGLTLDKQGRLIVCEQDGRKLSRLEKDGKMTVLADRFEGKRLNSPNDVVVKSDGSIYFTDPPYGLKGQDKDPAKELAFNGVFRWKDGKLEALYKEMTRPNGIAFSPDEKYLYVANSDGKQKVWMRFDVAKDGTLAGAKVFVDSTSDPAPGGPDGMKVDQKGNLWATGPGGIWVISPDGRHLGTIAPAEVPANCHWGDKDAKTLYITARRGLYRIRTSVAGVRP
jgi:gluconolactonase